MADISFKRKRTPERQVLCREWWEGSWRQLLQTNLIALRELAPKLFDYRFTGTQRAINPDRKQIQ